MSRPAITDKKIIIPGVIAIAVLALVWFWPDPEFGLGQLFNSLAILIALAVYCAAVYCPTAVYCKGSEEGSVTSPPDVPPPP